MIKFFQLAKTTIASKCIKFLKTIQTKSYIFVVLFVVFL